MLETGTQQLVKLLARLAIYSDDGQKILGYECEQTVHANPRECEFHVMGRRHE
jgi:hypothetical protein